MFDALRDLYQDVILDHGRKPRHMLKLDVFDAAAKGDNPMCGDRCEVRLRYAPDGRIGELGFSARGCAISVASADLMVDAVTNRTPDEARRLFRRFGDLIRTGEAAEEPDLEPLRPLAGVSEYPSRIKCATLPWHALMAALAGAKEASSE